MRQSMQRHLFKKAFKQIKEAFWLPLVIPLTDSFHNVISDGIRSLQGWALGEVYLEVSIELHIPWEPGSAFAKVIRATNLLLRQWVRAYDQVNRCTSCDTQISCCPHRWSFRCATRAEAIRIHLAIVMFEGLTPYEPSLHHKRGESLTVLWNIRSLG